MTEEQYNQLIHLNEAIYEGELAHREALKEGAEPGSWDRARIHLDKLRREYAVLFIFSSGMQLPVSPAQTLPPWYTDAEREQRDA